MPDDGESEELQDEFELSGVVKNRTTQEAVAGVEVSLQEEEVSTISNGKGQFSFLLKPGTYTLTVDNPGFEEWSEKITLVKGKPNSKQVSVELIPSLKKID